VLLPKRTGIEGWSERPVARSNTVTTDAVVARAFDPKATRYDASAYEALALYNAQLPRLQEFILPAGTRSAALAHVGRTVARRAERAVVALAAAEPVNAAPRQYLNRLSDLLFVLARVLNRANLDGLGGDDVYWKSQRLARAQEGG
jgi:ATP:cob(I)alamin adenosyltransferase